MNVLVVDDHTIVRDGLRRLLGSLPSGAIHEAANGRDAVRVAATQPLDLIVLDLNLPEFGGFDLLERLVKMNVAAVLVFSMHAEPLYVVRAMAAGARGFVSKGAAPEELLTAVRRVVAGGKYIESDLAQSIAAQVDPSYHALDDLAARDLEILSLLTRGRSLTEIAAALDISYKTVANRLSLIKTKLGVSGTAELVRVALEAGVS
ncbi:MAG TPA: response regulator transcription factor [Caulobacteraceae bacterium]|jgi:DNA-binding NarL/FixJ family response regulator|nr:response regulator transcription factor [Caulobacteraceae bacterium]